ncbi:DUF362 domain-containing protein [Candidatus Margulisiibacteriota bacterium]
MSKVFFTKDISKADKLFDSSGIGQIISQDDFVALKIHFGERGNTAYIKPDRAKPIVKKVKEKKGKPFWIDSNTLYKGSRSNTLVHLQTAFDHGYTSGKTGAHVLINDGLVGWANKRIAVDYKHLKEIFVGPTIFEADVLIAVSHFKGHEVTGFGGAIKNISMGLASRAGKQQMHADIKPRVDKDACTACGKCLDNCPESAIDWDPHGRAEIDLVKCIGCGQCIVTCAFDAIPMSWAGSPDSVSEKMVEYCAGIVKQFDKKVAYINFITDVSENCDCYDHNSEPIVPDIGILASFDPVAIDQASVDLVNKAEGRIKGNDKLKTIWPSINWEIQLKYAEEIGLGSRKYELL